MQPKIDIIIPTYNRAYSLSRAMNSVIQQSYKDWQLWVIDDGSTDGTSEILKKYSAHPKINSFKTDNRGVSAARNFGIKKSSSPLIAFLDSDDEWLPQKLSLQVQFMENQSQISLVHGEEIWIRNGVRVNPMKKHQKEGGDIFGNSLKLCCISPSTVLLRRSLFDEVGLFREDFPVCEDYDLWLKITSRYSVGFINENLIKKYGGHGDQLSRKLKAMDYWRVKSMGHLLEQGSLSEEQRQMVQETIKQKSQVLLKGYRKHENLHHYDEVFNFKSHPELKSF